MHMRTLLLLPAMLAGLSACTQVAAPVVDRSAQTYSRSASGFKPLASRYLFTAPDSSSYSQDAAVEPVVMQELAPVTVSAPQSITVEDVKPVASMPPRPSATNQQQQLSPPRSALPKPEASIKSPAPSLRQASFIWPVEGKVISHFGGASSGQKNDGINIAAGEGEPVWAAKDGTVAYVGNELRGYGNMVILKHEGGWATAYAHASSIAVSKGDAIKQGQIIAYVGSTGGAKAPQLYFSLREGKSPVNPEDYLMRDMAALN